MLVRASQYRSPADRHHELFTLSGPVDSGHGPGDTDAKEDVDGVRTGDVADGGVGGVVLDRGDLTGEGV